MRPRRGIAGARRALPHRARGGLRLSGAAPPPPAPVPPPASQGGGPAQSGRLGSGLRGAALLARGQGAGLALIDGTPEGALASFRAALVCLPGFILLRLLGWSNAGVPDGGALLGMAAEIVGFALAWAGYALATLPAAEAAQRRDRWPLFLAAWNYTNVVQYVVLLAASGVPLLLGLPDLLPQVLGLAALGYVLWLEWFVARTALGVTGVQAAGFVLLDIVISVFVAGLVARLAAG